MTIAQICILLAIAVYLLAMLGVASGSPTKTAQWTISIWADGSWGPLSPP